MWRWTGFHFGKNINIGTIFSLWSIVTLFFIGLDLVLSYDHGSLKLRRNHRMENEMALSQQARRNIMFR